MSEHSLQQDTGYVLKFVFRSFVFGIKQFLSECVVGSEVHWCLEKTLLSSSDKPATSGMVLFLLSF